MYVYGSAAVVELERLARLSFHLRCPGHERAVQIMVLSAASLLELVKSGDVDRTDLQRMATDSDQQQRRLNISSSWARATGQLRNEKTRQWVLSTDLAAQ